MRLFKSIDRRFVHTWQLSIGVCAFESGWVFDLFNYPIPLPFTPCKAADLPYAWRLSFVEWTLFVSWRDKVWYFEAPWIKRNRA